MVDGIEPAKLVQDCIAKCVAFEESNCITKSIAIAESKCLSKCITERVAQRFTICVTFDDFNSISYGHTFVESDEVNAEASEGSNRKSFLLTNKWKFDCLENRRKYDRGNLLDVKEDMINPEIALEPAASFRIATSSRMIPETSHPSSACFL